ncbi:hypothetical protein [Pantoea cypripedii]|uniref:SMODS and SLOG-associating 2TM effector domain-containing protein n=1 Tax=Pantoea cypripedii TaxID=55209 RepID=A0A1X1ET03_PANCY|nr:hypothetical protein [Pantoea cypripedii]MBP2197191.1 hypothetical protein [Pantoea cypripedii]ORM93122.1 hypothetical protein HA50_07095 [Pantoea cypripedii]
MTRHELIFDITYSHYLEKMYGTITGRIDRGITLIIIAVGLSAFTPIFSKTWFAAIIGLLSVAQIVYQFARQSGISEDLARKYLSLLTDADLLSDSELHSRFKSLQENDSNVWGVLKAPAYKRACISMGLTDTTQKLTFRQKAFAMMAGDITD